MYNENIGSFKENKNHIDQKIPLKSKIPTVF